MDESAKKLEQHRNSFSEFASTHEQPEESQSAAGDRIDESLNVPDATGSEAPELPPEKRRRITSKMRYSQVTAKVKVLKGQVKADWIKRGRTSGTKPVKKAEGGGIEVVDELRGPKVDTTTGSVDLRGIDKSHHKMMVRDVVFCKKCGYHGTWKAQMLKLKCNEAPKHHNAKQQLDRMLRGLYPNTSVLFWPCGGPSTIGSQTVINIDGV